MVDAARLRRRSDIAAVRASGRVRSGRLMSVRALGTSTGEVRIAVSGTRDAGGAVARNRARRRVSAALRAELGAIAAAPSVDLLVSARPAAVRAPFADLRTAARAALDAALGARP